MFEILILPLGAVSIPEHLFRHLIFLKFYLDSFQSNKFLHIFLNTIIKHIADIASQ